MTLKRRVAVGVSIVFSLLLGLAESYVYFSFATFRKEEFYDRLGEKALTTAKLLVEVNEVDRELLRLIDKNTVNRLYNEKTLVFDSNYQLIYSSIDDATVRWKIDDLKRLKDERRISRSEDGKEMLGIFYDFDMQDYYVLVAAEDKYGYTRLAYLRVLLLITFVLGTALVWLATYFVIRRFLKPLDEFQEQITTITANKLRVQLEESGKAEEIRLLASAFNNMLLRIDESFASMREFTSNASHELRTPLARIAFQLENLIKSGPYLPETEGTLKGITQNVYQLSGMVNSLLLLSEMDREDFRTRFKRERLDEIIFSSHQQVRLFEPRFQLGFEIFGHENEDHDMEVFGVRPLLEVAITNLLRNACLYSSDQSAHVVVDQSRSHEVIVRITNKGKALSQEEERKLFEPFIRGSNSANTQGSGLGLRITRRILDFHRASVNYSFLTPDTHQFELRFPVPMS
jgi:two-component system sensor histidine kinase ArlS